MEKSCVKKIKKLQNLGAFLDFARIFAWISDPEMRVSFTRISKKTSGFALKKIWQAFYQFSSKILTF